MKKTAIGMTMTKSNSTKSNDCNLFHQSLRTAARRLMKNIPEHSIIHVTNSLSCKFQKLALQ